MEKIPAFTFQSKFDLFFSHLEKCILIFFFSLSWRRKCWNGRGEEQIFFVPLQIPINQNSMSTTLCQVLSVAGQRWDFGKPDTQKVLGKLPAMVEK